MEFHVYQVLYLDNLILYMSNTNLSCHIIICGSTYTLDYTWVLWNCLCQLLGSQEILLLLVVLKVFRALAPASPQALTLLPPFTQPPRSQRAQLHLLNWLTFSCPWAFPAPFSSSSVFRQTFNQSLQRLGLCTTHLVTKMNGCGCCSQRNHNNHINRDMPHSMGHVWQLSTGTMLAQQGIG